MTWFRVIKEACYSEQYTITWFLHWVKFLIFSNILYKLVLLFFLVVEAVYASVNYEGCVCAATEQTDTGKWALIL